MTNDERFQVFQRLGQEADVAHVSVDNVDRLRSEMREEMSWHRPLVSIKTWAAGSAEPEAKPKSNWEADVNEHESYWAWAREVYAEWKMVEDDDFWTAIHQSTTTGPSGPGGGER